MSDPCDIDSIHLIHSNLNCKNIYLFSLNNNNQVLVHYFGNYEVGGLGQYSWLRTENSLETM